VVIKLVEMTMNAACDGFAASADSKNAGLITTFY